MDKLLTVQEAADNLRVSRSTIWRWCRDGTLSSAFKVGRNWRIRQSEVEKIMGQSLFQIKSAGGELKKVIVALQLLDDSLRDGDEVNLTFGGI
jgi:excisionase family DNA binding protein